MSEIQSIAGPSWEAEFAQSLRTAEDLLEAGFISSADLPQYRALLRKYQFALPRYYAALIDSNDPLCPIRRQAIPVLEEDAEAPGFVPDPLADLPHRTAPRVTHRYPNRALLHLTSSCSMYCRFCFRKTLLNEWSDGLFRGALEEALGYVAAHPEIEEVILSGGDPLMAGDRALRGCVQALAEVGHLQRLRIHTRVPVTFPARVTAKAVDAIRSSRLPVVVVTHFNHPREVTNESGAACARLATTTTLLNQTVLLRQVNDRAETLAELSRALFRIGVLPYYLHQADAAAGAHHFVVPAEEGLAIFRALREQLPGYLVPRYVQDVVGMPYKAMVTEL